MITAEQAARDAAEVKRIKQEELDRYDMDIVNRMLKRAENVIVEVKNNGDTICSIKGGDFYTGLLDEYYPHMNGNQKKFKEIMEKKYGYEIDHRNGSLNDGGYFSISFSHALEDNEGLESEDAYYDLTSVDDRNLGNQFAHDAEINDTKIDFIHAESSDKFLTIDLSEFTTSCENIDFNNLRWGTIK
jgi:hypothetical protein